MQNSTLSARKEEKCMQALSLHTVAHTELQCLYTSRHTQTSGTWKYRWCVKNHILISSEVLVPFQCQGSKQKGKLGFCYSHFMFYAPQSREFSQQNVVSDDRYYNLSHSNVYLNYPTKQLESQALNLLLKSSFIDRFDHSSAREKFYFGQGMDIPVLTHSSAPAEDTAAAQQWSPGRAGASTDQQLHRSPILVLAECPQLPKIHSR